VSGVYVVGPVVGLPEVAVVTQLASMGVALAAGLDDAEEILLIPGWIASADARRAIRAAREAGMPVRELVVVAGNLATVTWARAPRISPRIAGEQ
jgi:hypothetical protein